MCVRACIQLMNGSTNFDVTWQQFVWSRRVQHAPHSQDRGHFLYARFWRKKMDRLWYGVVRLSVRPFLSSRNSATIYPILTILHTYIYIHQRNTPAQPRLDWPKVKVTDSKNRFLHASFPKFSQLGYRHESRDILCPHDDKSGGIMFCTCPSVCPSVRLSVCPSHFVHLLC